MCELWVAGSYDWVLASSMHLLRLAWLHRTCVGQVLEYPPTVAACRLMFTVCVT